MLPYSLTFADRCPKQDRIRVADAVVQVMADNMPATGDLSELETRPGQPSQVDLIQALRGKIPLWYAGHADVTLRRCAKWGDGWIPLAYPPGEEARVAITNLHRYTRKPAAPRDDRHRHAGLGRRRRRGGLARGGAAVEIVGITHLTLANYFESGHLHSIAGRSLGDHIAAMRRYWKAVTDLP
jgi:alkanesulfonate monooxygenase SsuD/methylene tetrahydromethanopterin reductase-like flavin-dependent oxidoreductase (luciferase family)